MYLAKHHQTGASLIEVLVAILLLSFGMLALGSMLSFAVQAPKLSILRTAAVNIANSHVERIRANPEGFAKADGTGGSYAASLHDTSWSNTQITASNQCTYPDCTAQTVATMDIEDTRMAIRRQLPAGDMVTKCSTTPCIKTSYGELWVIWKEPSTVSLLSSSSDNCPSELTSSYYGTEPPRCLYIRFKVE